jgi:hypothetical protein
MVLPDGEMIRGLIDHHERGALSIQVGHPNEAAGPEQVTSCE